MVSLKRKRLSFSEKYKAITDLESGTKSSKLVEKYSVKKCDINMAATNKEVLFNLMRLAQKGKTWCSDRMRIRRKRYLTGFKNAKEQVTS